MRTVHDDAAELTAMLTAVDKGVGNDPADLSACRASMSSSGRARCDELVDELGVVATGVVAFVVGSARALRRPIPEIPGRDGERPGG